METKKLGPTVGAPNLQGAAIPQRVPLLDGLRARFASLQEDPDAFRAQARDLLAQKGGQTRALAERMLPLVDVARSQAKERVSPLVDVAQSQAKERASTTIARHLVDRVEEHAPKGGPRFVTVVGDGAIGRAVAAEARARGFTVAVRGKDDDASAVSGLKIDTTGAKNGAAPTATKAAAPNASATISLADLAPVNMDETMRLLLEAAVKAKDATGRAIAPLPQELADRMNETYMRAIRAIR